MLGHVATYSPEDDKLRIYLGYRLSAEDYAPIKAAGYHSAPKQGCVFAFWSPKAEDIALELCGEIEDEDKTLGQRAAERAERFDTYSDNRAKDAERAHAAVSAIADNIPLGQPILVGHHSERHARKDAERIENGMRKAVKAWKTSQYWKDRAADAIGHALYKERPDVRARRIKTLEAELRRCINAYTPDPKVKPEMQEEYNWADMKRTGRTIPHVWIRNGSRGGHWVPEERLPGIQAGYARTEEHLMHRLEYEHAMLDEQGAAVLLQKKAKSPSAQLPLCNYRAPEGLSIENKWNRGEFNVYRQQEMTQAEYAKIYADYKGTRVVDNSHRVRIAILRGHEWVCVFLTDSKVHERPAPLDKIPAKPDPVAAEQARVVREARQQYREGLPAQPVEEAAPKFEQLADTLKAGVQVVTAPQLFATPKDLARKVVQLARTTYASRVLEPSAGTGALVFAVIDDWHDLGRDGEITAVEANHGIARILSDRRDKHPYVRENALKVLNEDFLACDIKTLGTFDSIVMNPPFENAADIKHVKHAMRFLTPGGRLVAICANGPRQQEQLAPLGRWEPLPAGTFEEAGTMVNTAIFIYDAMCQHEDVEDNLSGEKCRNCGLEIETEVEPV